MRRVLDKKARDSKMGVKKNQETYGISLHDILVNTGNICEREYNHFPFALLDL